IDTFTRKPFLWGICFCFVAQLIPYCRGLSYFSCQSQFLFALISGLDQIEATKLNPPSKPWRSSLRMPKTQCSGPKNHVTSRAVFNAMRSTEVFGLIRLIVGTPVTNWKAALRGLRPRLEFIHKSSGGGL